MHFSNINSENCIQSHAKLTVMFIQMHTRFLREIEEQIERRKLILRKQITNIPPHVTFSSKNPYALQEYFSDIRNLKENNATNI